jgi:5-methylcytosine-specific restriction endonuclease McrA
MSSINLRTLVLNPNYMPVSVFPNLYTIPAEDAITRYLNDNCRVEFWHDRPILTASRHDLYWPSVIINNNTRSFKKEVSLKRSTLYYRDHMLCAYCSDNLDFHEITFDHVIPKVKGGKHAWDNVVLACKECNSRKGDQLPKGRWEPKRKPYVPTFYNLLENRKKFPIYIDDENWRQFLPGFTEMILRTSKEVREHDSEELEAA